MDAPGRLPSSIHKIPAGSARRREPAFADHLTGQHYNRFGHIAADQLARYPMGNELNGFHAGSLGVPIIILILILILISLKIKSV